MRPVIRKLILSVALGVASAGVLAQNVSLNWDPRTGDVWVDSRLADVNQYGTRYREPFIDELHRYYGAPRDLVTDLLVNRRWAPGDVYYACAIASIIGRPCRYVVDEWERDHGQGWGAVAQRMGIKPGSAEFHRLKRGFVPTYDRWGRPITLDRDLERDFPNRGKSGKALPPGQAKEIAVKEPNQMHGRPDHQPREKGGKGNNGQSGRGKGQDGNSGKGNNGKGKN